jgi:hypothetical protein
VLLLIDVTIAATVAEVIPAAPLRALTRTSNALTAVESEECTSESAATAAEAAFATLRALLATLLTVETLTSNAEMVVLRTELSLPSTLMIWADMSASSALTLVWRTERAKLITPSEVVWADTVRLRAAAAAEITLLASESTAAMLVAAALAALAWVSAADTARLRAPKDVVWADTVRLRAAAAALAAFPTLRAFDAAFDSVLTLTSKALRALLTTLIALASEAWFTVLTESAWDRADAAWADTALSSFDVTLTPAGAAHSADTRTSSAENSLLVTLAPPPTPLFALTRFDSALWAEVRAETRLLTVFTLSSTLVAAAEAAAACVSAADTARLSAPSDVVWADTVRLSPATAADTTLTAFASDVARPSTLVAAALAVEA